MRTVLLERAQLTSGTTWLSAGVAWSLKPCETEIGLLKTTQNMMMELEKESGENAGWLNNGGLFLAHNEQRMDEYRRLVDIGKVFGVGARIINSREAKELFPLLDDNAFIGAIHSPKDGSIDPTSLVSSLAQCSKNRGAQVN